LLSVLLEISKTIAGFFFYKVSIFGKDYRSKGSDSDNGKLAEDGKVGGGAAIFSPVFGGDFGREEAWVPAQHCSGNQQQSLFTTASSFLWVGPASPFSSLGPTLEAFV
jgi:hypothetical protein